MNYVLEYSWSQLPDTTYTECKAASQLSKDLRAGWHRARVAGALRYDVGLLQSRQLSGTHSYLLQLNPARASKRRAAAPIHHVRQTFDPAAFNFTQVPPTELVMQLRSRDRGEDVHSILVNVSPISELHSLFCPSLERCLPQVVTLDSLSLAVELYFLAADRDLRIGFNSMCALASVNHLHYHLLVEERTLPVEQVKCEHLAGSLYCLDDYPVPGFCFHVTSKRSISHICSDAYRLLHYFLEKEIAHNLMITRGRGPDDQQRDIVRIIIWPRRSSCGAKQFDAFNVALCELSGWFPVYDEESFNNLTQSEIETELSSWKLDSFGLVKDAVTELYRD